MKNACKHYILGTRKIHMDVLLLVHFTACVRERRVTDSREALQEYHVSLYFQRGRMHCLKVSVLPVDHSIYNFVSTQRRNMQNTNDLGKLREANSHNNSLFPLPWFISLLNIMRGRIDCQRVPLRKFGRQNDEMDPCYRIFYSMDPRIKEI